MVVLLDDLLDVARITQGRLLLHRRSVALRSVVAAAVESSTPHIEARQHTLTVVGCDDDTAIDVDPVRTSQVLTNLLNNAARYTDPGGRITLAARISDRDVEFSVRDNGMGISPEAAVRVFDMFEQVNPQTQQAQGGLGIGLGLTKGIVELHGGAVSMRSDGLGKGAEFTVTLPGVVQQDARAA